MKFRLALAQMDPVLGNLRANLDTHVRMARQAAAAGAQLVVFPELSLTGYGVKDLNWDLALNPVNDRAKLSPLLEVSTSIAVIAGGVEEGSRFGLYNAAWLFSGGEVRPVHRKVYPPTYGMFEELRYFSRGTSVRAFDTPVGRLGVLICEDLWHPSLPYLLALDGASVIIALVASPTRVGGKEAQLPIATVNSENHRAYARLLSVYLAFCNRVGFEDGVNFWGGSEVVAPDGTIAGTSPLFKEDLLLADLDDNEIRRARRFSRHFLDEDPGLVRRELARILRPGGPSNPL
jgi:predicted amidohydrolase